MERRAPAATRAGLVVVVAVGALALPACGASTPPASNTTTSTSASATGSAPSPPTPSAPSVAPPPPAAQGPRRPRPPLIAILRPASRRPGLFGWIPAAEVRGRTAVWISRVRAHGETGFTITLLRFDQRLVTLALHAGGSEPGGSGWRFGDAIGQAERRVVVAAFNSAFREGYGAGGFMLEGRVGWPLRAGAASVVVYGDGTADIGSWRRDVPATGHPVAAVRQNLGLLIDSGRIPPSVDTCVKVCWGDPLHEQPIVARSGLGITAGGQLIWAAGHNLSVRALAEALAAKGAVRAMELDINPRWVAGYLYRHPQLPRGVGVPAAIPVVPGQTGIPGQFLQPYFRDFFTVITRRSPAIGAGAGAR